MSARFRQAPSHKHPLEFVRIRSPTFRLAKIILLLIKLARFIFSIIFDNKMNALT